ncbi:MAG: hypothetical protein N2376_01740 [Clostridia bacterium]|nr:hypothetical protein [Clostridia bacterium]
MSATLAKIHYWLYNKIQWYEALEQDLIDWARQFDEFTLDEWIDNMYNEFGRPAGQKPLEEVVDQSNIHAWLQSRIESAELRQAFLVTKILTVRGDRKGEIVDLYRRQGEKAAAAYPYSTNTPEELFKAMNDFILEGMPCDNVNEVTHQSDDFITWKVNECIHKPHWERVKGEVGNFYNLREEWIKAFIIASNPDFRYEKMPDGSHRIIRHNKMEKEA